jgi:hypothetical protein
MPELDPSRSECFVSIYREGVLAPLGHDLKLRVADFTIRVDGETSVQAEFRADSLRVLGALKNGRVAQDEPSSSDKQAIEATIRREILESGKYPAISFRSTSIHKDGSGYGVQGRLELHGTTRDVQFTVELHGGRASARVLLLQPDFGITPYRAFLGALRVKPEVLVEVSVPFEPDPTGE